MDCNKSIISLALPALFIVIYTNKSLETMDNLRNFLDERCPKMNSTSGEKSWRLLVRKLDELKQQDFVNTCKKNSDIRIKTVDRNVETKSMYLSAKSCTDILQASSLKSKPPHVLISHDDKAQCDTAIQDLRILISANLISKLEFVNNLLDHQATLPLQLVWKLQVAGLMQISTYVFKKFQVRKESLVSAPLLWLLTNSSESSEYSQMAQDVIASLLIASQSGPLNLPLSTICSACLRQCTEDVVDWVLKLERTPRNFSENAVNLDFSFLTSSELRTAVGPDAMERLVLTYLLLLLNNGISPHSTQALLSAVEIQEKATLESVSVSFQNLLLSVVKTLGGEKVVNHLAAAVVRPLINWKVVFLLTAAVVAENAEYCANLIGLTDDLICLGLEGGRRIELLAGFLLARHCCYCDSKNFSTYSVWFSSHFGPDSVTARNAVQFQLLLQLLTEIVPVESAENLRVHINKVPQAPTSCNSILHDYAVLARTRLSDLNESSELPGLFSESTEDSYPGLDSRQKDVVKVLQHFQQTQEIINPVIEASIFRRQYYRNNFLVELLCLPGSCDKKFEPENYGLNSDTRHEFILALKAMGKIPEKLFKAYTNFKPSQELDKIENIDFQSKVIETKGELSEQSRRKKSLQVRVKKQ